MSTHVFDEAIALQAQPDGSWTGHTHPAYANMVGPFGGITAAQALNGVLQHPERLGDPVSLTVNFCAALADGPFTVMARAARTNRSTQHWTIEIQQGDAIVMTGTAVTAVRRETWGVDEEPMPLCPPPAEVLPPQVMAPMEFVKRYEQLPVTGQLPAVWDGSGHSSLSQIWVRDNPPRPLDFASLACISDIFFPRVFIRRATHVPVGTVSLTVYFHASAEQLAATGTGYLLGQAQAQAFRNGFFDQSSQLWNEAGVLLVTTHQIVYYKQ
ncbi:Thioesterase-like superfamily [Comamonadaceae bacterium]